MPRTGNRLRNSTLPKDVDARLKREKKQQRTHDLNKRQYERKDDKGSDLEYRDGGFHPVPKPETETAPASSQLERAPPFPAP